MHRDPAIHIRRSDFLDLCKKAGITFPEDFVGEVMQEAIHINIKNRVSLQAKAVSRKKLEKTIMAEEHIVESFNKIYDMTLKERNIRAAQVRKDSRTYLTLKEIAQNAVNFCKMFNFVDLEAGFKMYMVLGLEFIDKKYNIYRLKGCDDRIINRYASMEKIVDDPDKDGTARMQEAWKQSLFQFHSMEFPVDTSERQADLIYARETADKLKADYQDYMDAQFDRFSYLNAMPEFYQLYGENAELAYHKYMASQKREYTTEEERKYFKTVKRGKKVPLKKVQHQRGSQEA